MRAIAPIIKISKRLLRRLQATLTGHVERGADPKPGDMHCCHGFANLLNNASQRGLAVVVWRASGGIAFLLQSRGIAYEDIPKLKAGSGNLIINISTSVGFRYCPNCGRRLTELVEASPEYFEKLADAHQKIHDIPF